MVVKIEKSWKLILKNEFDKPYFKDLMKFVASEYQNYNCYPKEKDIFNAFNACCFNNLKVVIIGQDPYHGAKQANGLCFSVQDDIVLPPSLKNIFKELQTDIGKKIPKSGHLISWAKQGVLLLNATLTVRENKAGSHQKKGWETFTNAVINIISERKENIVFLLWGNYAKQKGKNINVNKHFVLTSGHPSPLSANRGYWFGNKHFSKTNAFLISNGFDVVRW